MKDQKSLFLNPISMFACGMLMGVFSRLLDIYTQNLGNVFSKLGIWVLLCSLISIYSSSYRRAMINTPLFCIGMIIAYYTVAVVTKGVYGVKYIIFWSAAALCSPAFAWAVRMTTEPGVVSRLIGAGIVILSFMSSVVLDYGIRADDFIINAVLAYFLLIKRRALK